MVVQNLNFCHLSANSVLLFPPASIGWGRSSTATLILVYFALDWRCTCHCLGAHYISYPTTVPQSALSGTHLGPLFAIRAIPGVDSLIAECHFLHCPVGLYIPYRPCCLTPCTWESHPTDVRTFFCPVVLSECLYVCMYVCMVLLLGAITVTLFCGP